MKFFIIPYLIIMALYLVFNYGAHLGEEDLEMEMMSLEEETPRSILCGK